MFRISSCSYMFRRIRSAIFREPRVIMMKLCVCYVMNAEQAKASVDTVCMLLVEISFN
jgi:hypothetical protein